MWRARSGVLRPRGCVFILVPNSSAEVRAGLQGLSSWPPSVPSAGAWHRGGGGPSRAPGRRDLIQAGFNPSLRVGVHALQISRVRPSSRERETRGERRPRAARVKVSPCLSSDLGFPRVIKCFKKSPVRAPNEGGSGSEAPPDCSWRVLFVSSKPSLRVCAGPVRLGRRLFLETITLPNVTTSFPI